MKIAIDAMGGDHAPESVVLGVDQAHAEFKDLEFILYGDEKQIRQYLKAKDRVKIVQPNEVISINVVPFMAIRRKKDS